MDVDMHGSNIALALISLSGAAKEFGRLGGIGSQAGTFGLERRLNYDGASPNVPP
jgi:hypothetical protein